MLLWLLRLIFPNAGWYVYCDYDFHCERYGPVDNIQAASYLETPYKGEINTWVRFNLW